MSNQVFLPKVSCIIIANDECSIFKILESIALQSYPKLECVIVNSPLSGETFDNVFNKVDIIQVEVDSEDENKLIDRGVSIASGEFVMILTSDNSLCNENVIAELLSTEINSVDVLYGNMIKVYPDGRMQNEIYPDLISIENILFDYLDIFPVSIFRKSLFFKYEFYSNELKFVNKYLFEIKLFFTNFLNIKYKNIFISYQNVNRSGHIRKHSVDHLVAKERDVLIEKYLSPALRNFLYKKIETENYINNSRTMVVVRKFELIKDRISIYTKPLIDKFNYSLRSFVSTCQLAEYKRKYSVEIYNTPIIINNRNHLSYLKRLINSLEIRGYKNLYIIDNDSDYEPLKEYYQITPYKVFNLSKNVGFCALWDTDIFDLFKNNYYVYTDSDLELVNDCPKDFLIVMQYFLAKYQVGKVGLSLPINDLPDYFSNKQEVITWESQFNQSSIEELVYKAKVDTTFALYGPGKFGHASMLTSLRIKFPYSARHLPWYENTSQLTDEQLYYYTNAKTSSHWSSKIDLGDQR